MKVLTYCILFSSGFGCFCYAQTEIRFNYGRDSSVSEQTLVTVLLTSDTEHIEILQDTVRKFETVLQIPSKPADYVLFVKFKNKTIETEALNYPFKLMGNETDMEINIRFSESIIEQRNRQSGAVEVIQYYKPAQLINIQYLPEMQGNEFFKAPFFRLENLSNDTIYGQYLKGHFWGSISFRVDSIWSGERFGILDFNFGVESPLFPDSTRIAQVGSFGWRNELPKTRYKYTLLYTTDKNRSYGASQHSENEHFIWWADVKQYYRLIYEFEVK
ncbi:MAG: hypothetical protein LBE56_10825 [Tannerella sp.]|nr:hypothetical protein [Tannerella sp.]